MKRKGKNGIVAIIPPSENKRKVWWLGRWVLILMGKSRMGLSKKIRSHSHSVTIIVPIMCASATLPFWFPSHPSHFISFPLVLYPKVLNKSHKKGSYLQGDCVTNQIIHLLLSNQPNSAYLTKNPPQKGKPKTMNGAIN